MSYEIKLPLFQGPFDLLLFFIERDELDIYDIPISKITDDFLDYIHQLETMNIEVASEFMLVAATLMRIKAKMLLPRPQLDDEGNEIDPRQELVKHLLEYKRYKSVIQELSVMEAHVLDRDKRGNVLKELKKLGETANVEWELQDVDLYKLLKVYQKALEKFERESNRPTHQVLEYPYTIEEQKKIILEEVTVKGSISFQDLVVKFPSKVVVIFNFLSILEMLQLGVIAIKVGLGYNNFWISSKSEKVSN